MDCGEVLINTLRRVERVFEEVSDHRVKYIGSRATARITYMILIMFLIFVCASCGVVI